MNDQNELLLLPLPEPVEVIRPSLGRETMQHGNQFQPLKPYICYRITPSLPSSMMESFTRQAKNTQEFVMYMVRREHDQSNAMEDMAIELVDSNATLSTVYLFNSSSLPSSWNPRHSHFRRLFRTIFQKPKVIVTWTDHYIGLSRLFQLRYIFPTSAKRATFVPIHDRFKRCYRKIFQHELQCNKLTNTTFKFKPCTCRYRYFTSRDYHWSISQAIRYVFNETPNFVSTPSRELPSEQLILSDRDQTIESVGYCLSISKLWASIRSN